MTARNYITRTLSALAGALLLAASGEVVTATAATRSYVVVYKSRGPDRVPASRVDSETDAREQNLGVASRFRYKSALRGFAARLSAADAERLKRDPEIAIVEEDAHVEAFGLVPVAAGETPPSGVSRIGAARAGSVYEASTTNVAVIDTGVDLDHPDLNVESGANCVGPGPAQDNNGHGTTVAGTIAARNNGAGVVGVAPGTKIYSIKVFDSSGGGSVSQLLCGVNWVTAYASALNIGVANMSLGLGVTRPRSSCATEALHLAICNSTNAGVFYTVAAGNNARDFGGYVRTEPAIFPEVLTVTAMSDSDGAPGGAGGATSCTVSGTTVTEPDDYKASFSDFAVLDTDAAHTISAPGVCIESTANTPPGAAARYMLTAGTSIAAPHAAGVAALCLGQAGVAGPCAGLAPGEIVQKLRSDAAQHATPENGFLGDPLYPLLGYFGHLVSAEQSTVPRPAPAPAAPPAAVPPKKRARTCVVPRLRRLTVRKARRKLKRAKCRYRFRGRGRRVKSTSPKAGKRTSRKVVVRLTRPAKRRPR